LGFWENVSSLFCIQHTGNHPTGVRLAPWLGQAQRKAINQSQEDQTKAQNAASIANGTIVSGIDNRWSSPAGPSEKPWWRAVTAARPEKWRVQYPN
jgi:hypothetical protein